MRALFLALALAGGLGLGACHHHNPDALWQIVHGQCVPDQQQHGKPAPCAQVELGDGEERGYALLKDINGPYQFLLIPTARIGGVESPAAWADNAPMYWLAAWEARRQVEQAAGRSLPRDMLGLAVNSRYGRSQNQLHIHVDCLKPEVREILHAHLGEIGERWNLLEVPLAGRYYRAMRLSVARFSQDNPLHLLEDSVGAEQMARQTLVVAGATFEDGTPGFILLNDHADLWRLDRGHGEDLQDHACRS